MKIIYSGGLTRAVNAADAWWVRHDDLIRSGKSAIITLAKPDGSYDQFIKDFTPDVEIIDSKITNVDWAKYKAIFIAGGPTKRLHEEMAKRGFAISKLDPEAIVLGDSSGAYIMCSSYFIDSDGNPGTNVKFYEGYNPSAKNICIAHFDNPYYTNDLLIKQVHEFASEHGLKVIDLKENEEFILEQ